ncbi:MAG: ABC transporter ATP-binding protein [Actinomycetaceae bacterium]|nr:ABC transporter ATP-binding protein [Actinomycetaceae bacterium]MDU0969846.1 ABC transporter ATP-binding protein [Actinomycetaceae bacterium]
MNAKTEHQRTDTQPALVAAHASHLTKSFGDVKAVIDVSFEIAPGEIVALLGPNGAGKTTVIDMLLGLQRPDSGTSDLWGMSAHEALQRCLVSAVQQTGALDGELRVKQLLSLVAATMPAPRDLDDVMAATGITGIASRRVSKCSGGEAQRIRLAVALLGDPLFLFLDEPTVGMDVAARAALALPGAHNLALTHSTIEDTYLALTSEKEDNR